MIIMLGCIYTTDIAQNRCYPALFPNLDVSSSNLLREDGTCIEAPSTPPSLQIQQQFCTAQIYVFGLPSRLSFNFFFLILGFID